MSQPITSGSVLSASVDKAQAVPLAVDKDHGAGQGLVQVDSVIRDFLVGVLGEAEPEASWDEGQQSQGRMQFPSTIFLPHSGGVDGWGQEEEEGGCPSRSPPPPPRILHVITKCNLVWGAEGFLSTSA